MDKTSIVNDLYQAAIMSVFTVDGKKILKITPPSIQKFDLEDTYSPSQRFHGEGRS